MSTDHLQEVTDNNFQAVVLESEKPVLVDFWAPWCAPCNYLTPILEKIAQNDDSIDFVRLNTDDNRQTAGQYNILSIPTMIVFRSGAEAKRLVGLIPESQIRQEIKSL